MARRVTRPTTRPVTTGKQKPIVVEKTGAKDFFISIRDLMMSDRFRIAVGVILASIVLMLIVAYCSFFFTGSEDYSIVKHTGDRSEMRGEIQNTLGLPGAIVADWLVDGTFGLMSIIALIALGLYAARLIVEFPLRRIRLLFITLFLLVWSAVALGFAQQIIGMGSFFRWGGAVGDIISTWAMSYIQWFGLLIILLATIIVFLIVIDKHFVEHCQRIGGWIKKLFTKSKVEEAVDKSEIEDEQPSEPIDIALENTTEEASTLEEPAIVVDVEVANTEEEIIAEEVAEEVAEEIDKEEDIEVAVEEVKEVELSEDDPEYLLRKLGPYDPRKDLELYKFPSLNLLKVYDNETAPVINQEEQQANANRIVTTLRNYGIEIESIKATVGPTVTLYEIVPKAGVRIAKIQTLENDIMLSLAAMGIRIIAPIPGKGTIGIEVPNENPQVVSMHSVIASKRFQEEKKMRLPIAYGRTITNEVFMFDLAKTPHLLVAGATGTGKSVAINAIITSLLYKKHPAELKLVMVDPKMVEFSIYSPIIKHFLAKLPDEEEAIITDTSKVIQTLKSLCIEMDDRYKLLKDAGVRSVKEYNEMFKERRLLPTAGHRYMPYIVVIIDEYGDLIMTAGKEVEMPIARIAQKARAVGMHMIIATQRPTTNIVTGTIKANFPARMSFKTTSMIDSKTILDRTGANQLIGRGDLLFMQGSECTRVQCAFVDTPEVTNICNYIKNQQGYTDAYMLPEVIEEGDINTSAESNLDASKLDSLFEEAARLIVIHQQGSTSLIQRKFAIGYNRAGRLMDQLERAGVVGKADGSKPRQVLCADEMDLDNYR